MVRTAQPLSMTKKAAQSVLPSMVIPSAADSVQSALARRYLTTREAAAYCGYKNPSAIRKAVMERRLAASGRRGGNGTSMFSLDALDEFLCGAPASARVASGRPGAPSQEGTLDGHETMEETMEYLGASNKTAGSVAAQGRRISSSVTSDRVNDRSSTGNQEGAARGNRGASVLMVGGRES